MFGALAQPSCHALLQCGIGQGSKWSTPTGSIRFERVPEWYSSEPSLATQNEITKMTSARVCLWRAFQQYPAFLANRHFKISKWEMFPSHKVQKLQVGVFVLVLGVTQSVCEPFKSRVFIPYSSMVFLNVILVGFQSQTFGGLVSPVQVLRVGVPSMEHKPLTSQEKISYSGISPNCRSLHLRQGVYLPLLPVLMLSFYPLLWRPCSSSFQVSFRENDFICNCRFVVSVGGGQFIIFLRHFEPQLSQ